MTADNFLFKKRVGVLPERDEFMFVREPVRASIKLVQNGYELDYNGKDFVADNLTDAMDMIKKWMEEGEKEAKEHDKEEGNSDHNSSHPVEVG